MNLSRREFVRVSVSTAGGLATGAVRALSAATPPVFTTRPVRVGIIGLGEKGRSRLSAYTQTESCRVWSLCDVDEACLAECSPRFFPCRDREPYPRLTLDYRRVLSDPAVEVVSVAVPPELRFSVTVEALEADKDVLVEIPFSEKPDELGRLIETARAAGRKVIPFVPHRYSPRVRESMERMWEGEIGEVRMARIVCPAGAMHEPLDLARWGLGVGLPARIASSGNRSFFDRGKDLPDSPRLVSLTFDEPNRPDSIILLEIYFPEDRPSGSDSYTEVVFRGSRGRLVCRTPGDTILQNGCGENLLSGRSAMETPGEALIGGFLSPDPETASEIQEYRVSSMVAKIVEVSFSFATTLEFDPSSGRFANSHTADRLFRRHESRPVGTG